MHVHRVADGSTLRKPLWMAVALHTVHASLELLTIRGLLALKRGACRDKKILSLKDRLRGPTQGTARRRPRVLDNERARFRLFQPPYLISPRFQVVAGELCVIVS